MLAGQVQDFMTGDAHQIDMRLRVRVVVHRVIPRLPQRVDHAQVRKGVERVVDRHQRERWHLRFERLVDHRRGGVRLAPGEILADCLPLGGESQPGLT